MVKNKPVLLIHGALGCEKLMQPFAALITNRPCYVLNLTGHGHIPYNGDLSFDLFTKDIESMLNTNQVETCDVFGYSMGGYAALLAALHLPGRIEKIATLGTKMYWDPEISAKETKLLNPDVMQEKVPKYVEYLKSLHGDTWDTLVYQTANLMTQLGNGKALTAKDLSKIQNTVQIGLGALDKMVTKEESLWAVGHLKNAEFQLLEDVPHPIEKVQPLSIKKLLEFFE